MISSFLSDVYFREDPMPYVGALDRYDIQIPDSWATGKLNAVSRI